MEARSGLTGKVAVIVGGGHGVGRAVTLALATAGADVATCDNDQAALLETVRKVESLGQSIIAMPVDVCNVDALDQFYDEVARRFDRLDIVVNVVGGAQRGLFLETTREQNASDIRRNYGYVVDSVRRAIPLIRKGARGGSIINFTTNDANRGAATFAVYAGAQAATTNFTRAMAVELGSEQIRVNTVVRDATPLRTTWDTPPHRDAPVATGDRDEAAGQPQDMHIPQKRAPTEEDVANAVLLLVSDMMRAVTGITLAVDGGVAAAAGFVDWPYGDGFMPLPMAGTLNRLFP